MSAAATAAAAAATVAKPFIWFYYAFGLDSIHATGRNAYLIILARSCRMFAYGATSLILAIFFSALDFPDDRIGLFFTLTLLGDVFLGTFLTLIADRVGRRKVLLAGSCLMVSSGATFAYFENFWILLIAATLGVISVMGGDFGPFRSIEESILSQLTTPKTRADVLAWYVTMSTLGASLGSEASGRLIRYLKGLEGWNEVRAYHALFGFFMLMGVWNVVLVFVLDGKCELKGPGTAENSYAQVPQEDEEEEGATVGMRTESERHDHHHHQTHDSLPPLSTPPSRSLLGRALSWFTTRLAHISRPTLNIMIKLWLLLALDSLADGMVPFPLTNYYLDTKFHPSKSTLGDVTGAAYFLGAISSSFAGPLARKIGLINTMVFTHIPSSAAVLLFPFPNMFWLSVVFLLIRAGLNNMDQAPRSAFIAAVVKSEERTAVMGITSLLRTLAAMSGPTVTGLLAGGGRFWIAFVVAGACRLAYDCGLWVLFVNMKLYQHETDNKDGNRLEMRESDEEQEMQSLANGQATFKIEDDDDQDDGDDDDKERVDDDVGKGTKKEIVAASGSLGFPRRSERIRSRSPHQRMPSYQ